MLVRFESQSDLEDAMQALVKQDPRLKPILAHTGMPALADDNTASMKRRRLSHRSGTTMTISEPVEYTPLGIIREMSIAYLLALRRL